MELDPEIFGQVQSEEDKVDLERHKRVHGHQIFGEFLGNLKLLDVI